MKLKFSLSELVFLIGYSIYIFNQFLGFTMYSDTPIYQIYFSRISVLSVFFFILKIIYDRKISRKFIVNFIIIGLVMSFIMILSSQVVKILVYFLILFSLKKVNLKKVITVHASLMVLILIIAFISFLTNVIPDYIFYTDQGRVRHSLGFTYTSFAPNIFFHFSCIYVYIRSHRISLLELVFMLLFSYYLYIQTDTKNAFVLTLILITFTLFIKLSKVDDRFNPIWLRFLEKNIVLISSIISISLTFLFFYPNSFMINLNYSLGGRLHQGVLAIKKYGLSLFGSHIKWNVYLATTKQFVGSYLFVDSSFVNILLNFGLVVLVVLILGFYFLPKINFYSNIYYSISFIILTIHATWDPQFFELWYNPYLIFLSLFIFNRKDLNFLKPDRGSI